MVFDGTLWCCLIHVDMVFDGTLWLLMEHYVVNFLISGTNSPALYNFRRLQRYTREEIGA